jgi:hypothetical protein
MNDALSGGKTQGEYMQDNMNCNSDHLDIPEQRMWRAVIASTVAEWVNGPLTKKREAEQFLFHDQHDYRTVCFSAGINPETLRARLEKIRECKTEEFIAAISLN